MIYIQTCSTSFWSFLTNDIFWSAFGAIATAIGAIAIVFAISQIRFEAWLKAQEIWTASEFTNLRERIYQRLNNSNADWSNEEENKAKDACRKLDELAGLIPYLPKKIAIKAWGVPYAKLWTILEPIVIKERKLMEWPDKWKAFEKLGKSSLKQHPGKTKIK
jgi:hypothetical protein